MAHIRRFQNVIDAVEYAQRLDPDDGSVWLNFAAGNGNGMAREFTVVQETVFERAERIRSFLQTNGLLGSITPPAPMNKDATHREANRFLRWLAGDAVAPEEKTDKKDASE